MSKNLLFEFKKSSFRKVVSLAVAACSLLLGGALFGLSTTANAVDFNRAEGLKGIPVPEPSNLYSFVKDKRAAIELGKALFWDRQVGSDGETACASCHFHAGADNRSRNSVGPSLNRKAYLGGPDNPDTSFQTVGPNGQLIAELFPFVDFYNPNSKSSGMSRYANDVVSSQGVYRSYFFGVYNGRNRDEWGPAGDSVFNVGGVQTRRAEPRNAPTVINAIFNLRNFWDGRAAHLFNGKNPFGAYDKNASVFIVNPSIPNSPYTAKLRIDHASLASLGTGPALSEFEMSAMGRTWPDIGKRLISARALAGQEVAASDSVLAPVRDASGIGLAGNYGNMITAAFKPELWAANVPVSVNGKNYTQMEANFSLFFGLATQLYQATLVSDNSPFDRYMAGDGGAMSAQARLGMNLFFGKGKCGSCHGGAEFTNASTRYLENDGLMNRMRMGNGEIKVYDQGFYNIGIAKTLNDVAVGEHNKDVDYPKSFSVLSKYYSEADFKSLTGLSPNIKPGPKEGTAVYGAFKTPTIRNAELTAPYFHNGSVLTLKQLVQFYNRGGNFSTQENASDADADIQPLGLSEAEQNALVEFIKATTDERVRYESAPFDHPALLIPNGHVASDGGQVPGYSFDGRLGQQLYTQIPAVGREGNTAPTRNFLDGGELADGVYVITAKHSGKVLEVAGVNTIGGAKVQQWDFIGGAVYPSQRWKFTYAGNGEYFVVAQHSGQALDVPNCNFNAGTALMQWPILYNDCQKWKLHRMNDGSFMLQTRGGTVLDIAGISYDNGAAATVFNWLGADNQRFWINPVQTVGNGVYTIRAKHSGKVLEIGGANMNNGASAIQWDNFGYANQRWRITHLGNNEYTVVATHSGKALDVPGCNFSNAVKLNQWDVFNNACQRWRIQPMPDNSFRFISSGGQALDIAGASTGLGASATIFEWHGGDNQRFYLDFNGL